MTNTTSATTKALQVLQALEALEALGYAVVIYSPKELAGVSPEDMEDYLIEQGNEYIALQEE